MTASRRPVPGLWPRLAMGLLLGAPLAAAPRRSMPAIRLFRLMTMRGDLLLGLIASDLAGHEPGSEVERLARRLAAEGVVSGWQYQAVTGPDGRLCLGTVRRVSVARQDALTLQPYLSDLPVLPPPG
ncbi:hypothetical protein ACVFYP_16540 [Roseomonas sp. F4]